MYSQPAQLGADRWAGMLGLPQHAPDAHTPLLLASFGTATTIDIICPAGTAAAQGLGIAAGEPVHHWLFEGGLILPGPALMRTSLNRHTARLPAAQGLAADFPDNTDQAIVSGIAAAQSGALLRQWQTGLARYGRAPRVFCTGGGWPLVADELQRALARAQHQCGADLVPALPLRSPILDGLARLAHHGVKP